MRDVNLKGRGKVKRSMELSFDFFDGFIRHCVDEENAKRLMDKEKFLEWLAGYSTGVYWSDSYIIDGIFEEIERGTFDVKQGDEI